MTGWWRALTLVGVLSACGQDDAPMMMPTPIQPTVVRNPPVLAVEGQCVAAAEGETVGGVSPEGDLWLLGTTNARVVSIHGDAETLPYELAAHQAFVAQSDQVAIVANAEGLWQLGAEGPVFRYLPPSLRAVRHFCGDPNIDGEAALVTRDGLFQRIAGEWFSVAPPDAMAFDEIGWMGSYDAACHGRLAGLWLLEGQHTAAGYTSGALLRRVAGSTIVTYDVPEEATGLPVVGANFFAIPASDTLLVAPEIGPLTNDWGQVQFAAGDITHAATSGDALYVLVGTRLFRLKDDVWHETSAPLTDSVVRLWPHAAGGLWVEGEVADDGTTRLCHYGPSPLVQVRGLRPFEVFFEPTVDLQVSTSVDAPITLSIDEGAPLSGVQDEGVWRFEDLMLGAPGWHEVAISMDDAVQRKVAYRVVAGDISFRRDVAPIAQEFCATAACHGGGSEAESIPLRTFEEWTEAAFEINERVSRGTMPQETPPEWNAAHATTIVDWIQGGRQP